MATINLFKCIGKETTEVPDELLTRLGVTYEEISTKAGNIALLARILKDQAKDPFCRLPFCHTVEAEAFGSIITFDNKFSNRVREYAVGDLNGLADLKPMDLTGGRAAEVLQAVRILKDQGETVIFEVTGPITIGTCILESQLFFKAVRKNRDQLDGLMSLIEEGVGRFILEAVQCGADIISFADPAGTLDIVGPKVYGELSGPSVVRILKQVEPHLGNAVVHLCGKTSTSLAQVQMLETENIQVEGDDYYDRVVNLGKIRPDIRLIGHWCLKSQVNKNTVTALHLV